MGRETLLTLLLVLFGGAVLQPFALLPCRTAPAASARVAEQRAWQQMLTPVLAMLIVAALLCGWALREPDPVRARFDHGMLIGASLPFAVLSLRAVLRAAWALWGEPVELPICTVGLLRPRIVFDPHFARTLDEAQIDAALEHERAHARHRDPLRIWLAQWATDLQWPWPAARRRFDAWLELLEHARDEEARRHGAAGIDLAAAVVATARRAQAAPRAPYAACAQASLLGDARSLARRVERLLAPLADDGEVPRRAAAGTRTVLAQVAVLLGGALLVGALYGNAVLHPFLLWTWRV